EVLPLVLLDEAVADVGDVELLPLEPAGVALEVRLDVVEEPGHLDGERLEGDPLAVAEAEVDGGLPAGRLRLAGLEAAPVADDLVQRLLALLLVARPVLLDGPLPGGLGLDVLPAVLVLAGDQVAGAGAVLALAA